MNSEFHAIVVDDDPFIAYAMEIVLSMSGMRVTTTSNGLAALAAHQRDPADILLTDLRMPRLDGTSLVARMRALNPEMPVIVVSGEISSKALLIASCDEHTTILTKPVSLSVLLDAIWSSLEASPRACTQKS